METESSPFNAVERIKFIDQQLNLSDAEYTNLTEEKRAILTTLTDADIKKLVEYTMSDLKVKRTAGDVEHEIRDLIANLKEQK